MQDATKAELVVVTAAGAFLLWLWMQNRDAGGGTGFAGLPSFTQPAPYVPGAAPTFNIAAPVAGDLFSYDGSGVANPSNPAFDITLGNSGGATGGGCNCAAATNGNSTFGSGTDLAAWLTLQPGLLADTASGLTGWY